jgi:hypothetical protein
MKAARVSMHICEYRLLVYFENTWIGRRRGRFSTGRRVALCCNARRELRHGEDY